MNAVDGTDDAAFPLGTLLAFILFVTIHIIVGCYAVTMEFNLAVSMGVTRKSFVSGYLLFDLLETAGAGVVLFLLYQLEMLIYRLTGSGMEMTEAAGNNVQFRYLLLALLGIISVKMIVGALLLRFGAKIFFGLWLLWLIPLIMKWVRTEDKDRWIERIAAFFQSFDPSFWLTAGFILELVLLLVSWLFLRKQRVTAI